MNDIKRNSDSLGTVLGFVRQYESSVFAVVSLTGIPYAQSPGAAIHRRVVNVYCPTFDARDGLDDSCNDGALLEVTWGDKIYKGFIEDKRIKWQEWKDGHGVGKFTFVVKEVVDA